MAGKRWRISPTGGVGVALLSSLLDVLLMDSGRSMNREGWSSSCETEQIVDLVGEIKCKIAFFMTST